MQACAILAAVRPDAQCDRSHHAEHERGQPVAKPSAELRTRQEKSAIVEKHAARKRKTAAQVRQRLEYRVVPEQNLQQKRNVADQFDIAAGKVRHQPIARQPRNTDGKTKHGRQHDAERSDQERVEKTDPECPAERRRTRRIVDQRLTNVETGGVIPEAKARGDIRF